MNNEGDNVLKRFQSGAVLTKDRIGRTEEQKKCQTCNVKEDIGHVIKFCVENRTERNKYNIKDETSIEEILQFKDRNGIFKDYLCELHRKLSLREGFGPQTQAST